MTDDELLLIYSSMRKFTESMQAREESLDQKTAALNAAISHLQQLPAALGKQTSQYIATGVRQSIQDDFSRPIETAVKGPLSELSREVYHARDVISQVRNESHYQTLGWVVAMVAIGIAIGVVGTWWFFQRDIGRIDDSLTSIQQQLTQSVPVPDTNAATAAPAKKHHVHPAAPSTAP